MTPPASTALPPGPKHHWLLGTGIGQLKDPLGQLIQGQQRHGDIVYFRMHHGPSWLLCHPDHAQHVLADHATNYLSMAGHGKDPLLGTGLFASQGDFWRRQRRMVQPSFHRPRLARMVEGMVRDLHRLLERWAPNLRSGEPVELLSQMRRQVIGMLGTSIFSNDVYETHAPMREAMDRFTHDIHDPRDSLLQYLAGMLGMHGARIKRFAAAIEQMNGVLYHLITERRQAPAGKDDILTLLLEAQDTQGVAMTDTEVRDELVSLYVGGYESTAVAMTWIGYEVASRPEVQQKVREELDRVLGGQPVTFDTLQSLVYTRGVVDETLRLHPPAWQFMRRAVAEDQLGGWTIRPDTKVLISPYLLHRHPAFWPQPEDFRPERFLPEQKEGRHRFAYVPFAAGQRQCVANVYTQTLLTVALATLLQHCAPRLAPDYQLIPMAGSTHRPRNGVRVTLHPVQPVA